MSDICIVLLNCSGRTFSVNIQGCILVFTLAKRTPPPLHGATKLVLWDETMAVQL